MLQRLTRENALFDFLLTVYVALNGCLSYNNCKMTEFKIHEKAGKVNWRVRTLDLWRTDSTLFRELLGRIPLASVHEDEGSLGGLAEVLG